MAIQQSGYNRFARRQLPTHGWRLGIDRKGLERLREQVAAHERVELDIVKEESQDEA
jgi:hypothetical protein